MQFFKNLKIKKSKEQNLDKPSTQICDVEFKNLFVKTTDNESLGVIERKGKYYTLIVQRMKKREAENFIKELIKPYLGEQEVKLK